MTDTSSSTHTPPALAAVEGIPLLVSQCRGSLLRQVDHIRERVGRSGARRVALEQIKRTIDEHRSGLIRLEGPAGSGVTTLLCHLALARPAAFWFGEEDEGQGAGALCTQLIALGGLPVPLVPPAANSDARVLEDLLSEAAARWAGEGPLVVVVDAIFEAYQGQYPIAPAFPAWLPPNLVVVYGCSPTAAAPLPAVATVTLNKSDLVADELLAAIDPTLPRGVREGLVAQCQGNFLYLLLAQGLMRGGLLVAEQLPVGLEELHRVWWSKLDATGRRLALVLAAAGEPLPDDLCDDLLGSDPLPFINQWGPLLRRIAAKEQGGEGATALYHAATRGFLFGQARKELSQIHAEVAARTQRAVLGERVRDVLRPVANALSWEASGYMLRQLARHAFLSPGQERAALLPSVASRSWIRLQQRRGSPVVAARDAAWELWGAAIDGPLLRLAASTFLAGSLATLARSLPADGPAEALLLALDTPERDAVLKRILTICDQLPDGREKAPLLRRLGEVCYSERRMRTTAMRLLSQALDLEAQSPPKTWRDEREQVLVALGRAALARGNWKEALEIAPRISHAERRGMLETDVVRGLITQGALDKAELVAHGIAHDSLRAWAHAEVAVARGRLGDIAEADALLDMIVLETARAWAQIELACDEARTDEEAAKRRIERLAGENQRDRGRARLAHVLAMLDKDGDALAMAEQIRAPGARVNALLDLRLTLEGLVAMLALEQATAVISSLEGDDRVPLIAVLAAAHAALGRRERAISIAEQLDTEEERDRALARVAVALGGSGAYLQAYEVVALVADGDERDWVLDELARTLGRAGRWEEASGRAREIADDDQRARTLAELVIDQGRQGDPLAAHALALSIDHQGERGRALMALVPLLVRAGQSDTAIATQDHFESPDTRSKYQTALVAALLEEASGLPNQQAATIWAEGRRLALTISRPGERVRALTLLAQAVVERNPVLAQATLGLALRTAASSRSEALRCLEVAAETFARLGGARLLVEVAATIDDIDGWLHG